MDWQKREVAGGAPPYSRSIAPFGWLYSTSEIISESPRVALLTYFQHQQWQRRRGLIVVMGVDPSPYHNLGEA